MTAVADVDTYIAAQPAGVQAALYALRTQIQTLIPAAVEVIAYGMPTYKLQGRNLVHFAAYQRHISLFPGTGVCQALPAEFHMLIHGASTLKLPLTTTFPHPVVTAAVTLGMQLAPGSEA